ncbi:g5304 [Coccomyxa elongata]
MVEAPRSLEELVRPHIDSFDYFIGEGLQNVVELLKPVEIEQPGTLRRARVWFESPRVARPLKDDAGGAADKRLFPRDCREAGTTYKGAFHLDIMVQDAGGGPAHRLTRLMGHLPIMLRSTACYLRHLTPAQLVARKEEAMEVGGYFICNGLERIIRMLIQQRRHYVMGLRRSAYQKRGPTFTDVATLLRCVRRDESSATVRCHYLRDGTASFAFTIGRAEYFVPVGVLLKCFLEVSDHEIFTRLLALIPQDPGGGDTAMADRVERLLQAAAQLGLHTRVQCLEYLGSLFRGIIEAPAHLTDLQAGEMLLREYVLIHLSQPADKLQALLSMTAKLFAVAAGLCTEDNADALSSHETLLPGSLLSKFMADKLAECLSIFKRQVLQDYEKLPEQVDLRNPIYVKRIADRMPDIGKKVEYLLNTGNLVSNNTLDLSQATGFTVVAEKLNFFRYLSHFRAIHRGAYFAQLRTTTVRKLLPESWGFLCPVHTPDGAPCGLLSHLTATCRIVAAPPDSPEDSQHAVAAVAASLGMVPATPALAPPACPQYIGVHLDGRPIGFVESRSAARLAARLRAIKAARLASEQGRLPANLPPLQGPETLVPPDLEVALVPYERGGPFPGLFLFTSPARMIRPVVQLPGGSSELIGTLEQVNLHIRCPDGTDEVAGMSGVRYSHAEINCAAMLSVVASLTPYSDFNQSPRNMYQCQMGKQTMGTPSQTVRHRTDAKLYRLQTPQTPIARTKRYDEYHMDEFPSGTNMIVAVLAYTGYDMEDAMILNRSAVDRGLSHGTLFKTEGLDLREDKGKTMVFAAEKKSDRDRPQERPRGAFGQDLPHPLTSPPASSAVTGPLKVKPQGVQKNDERIDVDGLPHVGAVVYPSQAYYSKVDCTTGKAKTGALKGEEVAVVDQVAIVGTAEPSLQRANVLLRLNRNPVVGDKFSSRHGQKGVLSQLWPDINMPFVAGTGMRPDLIINPHAFPSRMTIGMLMESLVSKAGAVQGKFVNGSPFQDADGVGSTQQLVKVASDALEEAGFSRLGGETLISGVTGDEFVADIYIGPVYYQRLRHMVSDKFQVRSTGPVNALTHQPIKGRKFGGGIRFGEMERDALLAHGAAYLLHDRLHTSSDYAVMDACASCGSILTPLLHPAETAGVGAHLLAMQGADSKGQVVCRVCKTGRAIARVALPFVLKYLVTELAAMNIKCTFTIRQ